jgi:lipopolysaccharide/colanic/teichoic acid biosynthesis glycosyltransferase
MATHKSSALPWVRKNFYENNSATSPERKLQFAVIHEAAFVQMLRFERRRAERSGKKFMLVLIGSKDFLAGSGDLLVDNLTSAIYSCTRETDVLGWYERDVTLGLLMTEIGKVDESTVSTIMQKISLSIQRVVSPDRYKWLRLIFRVFPQEVTTDEENAVLYPDLSRRHERKIYGHMLKRGMDIIGSLFAIIMFLPACSLIAVLVKLTSKGPVLFRQKRLGRYGREFSFFKFRTMYADNDQQIHREYVTKLISGDFKLGQGKGVYKLVDDPRITPIGRFIRKTSLDELPQFANVLKGDMSLVGPRPPLPYEYERYQTWHKRRVLELKPGLTGLWQVEGRSRTTFDEMVRMDLRYANMISLWVDLKILLRTPAAMLSGRGAC